MQQTDLGCDLTGQRRLEGYTYFLKPAGISASLPVIGGV